MSLRNHNWRDVVRVQSRHGFDMERQRRSRPLLKHIDERRITVPKHDTLKQGTLMAILDQADISKEQFLSETVA